MDFLNTNQSQESETTLAVQPGAIVEVAPIDGQEGDRLFAAVVEVDESTGSVLLEDLLGTQFSVTVDRVSVYTTKDVLRIINRYFLFEDIVAGVADADAGENNNQ